MMTSYWKARWPNTVLFGTFSELNYRIDIVGGGESFFRISTHSGPGFELELLRHEKPPGFKAWSQIHPAARLYWLDEKRCQEALSNLFGVHFSRLLARPETIACYCYPGDDLLPDGGQLSWCLSLIHLLWSAVPGEARRALLRSDFIQ